MSFTIGELPSKLLPLSRPTVDTSADVFLLTAEPILMEGSVDFRILEDKWTAVSADDRRWAVTSQYVAVLLKRFNACGLQNQPMSTLCSRAGRLSLSTQSSSHLTEWIYSPSCLRRNVSAEPPPAFYQNMIEAAQATTLTIEVVLLMFILNLFSDHPCVKTRSQ